MKRIISAALLSTALLAAPFAQAASYQDRTMATGAVVGATAGAVIGSNSNQAIEGAVFGAVLGTIAGVMIASNNQPVHVVQPVRHYQKPHRYQQHRKTHVQYHQPRVKKVVYTRYEPVARHRQHVQKVAYYGHRTQPVVRHAPSRNYRHGHDND